VKILAIRFARLGDVVLLLPALSSLKRAFPEARLTLLTGHRCTPIAELCPAVDETFAVDRVAMRDGSRSAALRDITRLVREVRRRRFDLVIDFHSFRETNLLTWLSGAPVRIGMKRYKAPYLNFCFNRPPVIEDKSLHVAAMFEKAVETIIPLAEAVNKLGSNPSPFGRGRRDSLTEAGAPGEARASRPLPEGEGDFSRATPLLQGGKWLCIPDELKHWACQIGHNPSRVAFYIDAPVSERIWPPERFAAVADFAIERWAALPLVIASQQRRDLVERVKQASRNPNELRVFSDLTVPQVAALIASARVFISNDTGPMHIGPALGVRTLGLFSVGYPEHFRPIGPKDTFLKGNPIEKIETADVIAIAKEMWVTADPSLRC